MEPKQKPLTEFRIGQARITVWEHEGAKGKYRSYTLSRIYKDKEGKWKHTEGFNEDDLLEIALLCQHTYAHFRLNEREQREKKS